MLVFVCASSRIWLSCIDLYVSVEMIAVLELDLSTCLLHVGFIYMSVASCIYLQLGFSEVEAAVKLSQKNANP